MLLIHALLVLPLSSDPSGITHKFTDVWKYYGQRFNQWRLQRLLHFESQLQSSELRTESASHPSQINDG